MTELSSSQKRSLRAAAHALKPVVSISQKGLTETVIKEIDRCLTAHELIKIRTYDCEREIRDALMQEVCTQTGAAAVQHIGNLLVVWRERPASPEVAGTRKAAPRKRGARVTKKVAAERAG